MCLSVNSRVANELEWKKEKQFIGDGGLVLLIRAPFEVKIKGNSKLPSTTKMNYFLS